MYEQKATTTKITAVSRCAVKIKDNFYTVEYSEERSLPENVSVDLDQERKFLWDDVNTTVDDQLAEIIRTFSK